MRLTLISAHLLLLNQLICLFLRHCQRLFAVYLSFRHAEYLITSCLSWWDKDRIVISEICKARIRKWDLWSEVNTRGWRKPVRVDRKLCKLVKHLTREQQQCNQCYSLFPHLVLALYALGALLLCKMNWEFCKAQVSRSIIWITKGSLKIKESVEMDFLFVSRLNREILHRSVDLNYKDDELSSKRSSSEKTSNEKKSSKVESKLDIRARRFWHRGWRFLPVEIKPSPQLNSIASLSIETMSVLLSIVMMVFACLRAWW